MKRMGVLQYLDKLDRVADLRVGRYFRRLDAWAAKHPLAAAILVNVPLMLVPVAMHFAFWRVSVQIVALATVIMLSFGAAVTLLMHSRR